jgi:hypothetical protein
MMGDAVFGWEYAQQAMMGDLGVKEMEAPGRT